MRSCVGGQRRCSGRGCLPGRPRCRRSPAHGRGTCTRARGRSRSSCRGLRRRRPRTLRALLPTAYDWVWCFQRVLQGSAHLHVLSLREHTVRVAWRVMKGSTPPQAIRPAVPGAAPCRKAPASCLQLGRAALWWCTGAALRARGNAPAQVPGGVQGSAAGVRRATGARLAYRSLRRRGAPEQATTGGGGRLLGLLHLAPLRL